MTQKPDKTQEKTENSVKTENEKPTPSEMPEEIGGPTGPEPTRFGDWERAGRCSDF
ncbi:DUF1674 domain-containing protein [Telmatospirillum sp. J64-1]|uniref:DUF1674 domain-containing protein n=1 Tax=Telmatospirillum sp. J64-1 TaxID=2502183 RepID=UPI00115D1B33|nr:succinate dehydrogenase assembly factor 4 [Telmatospirillum sp. J64-1]